MIVVTCQKRINTYYSVNFIDENDLYIGWDDQQCCCEHADYFISDEWNTPAYACPQTIPVPDLSGWNFVDPRILPDTFKEIEDAECDEGRHLAFMIVHSEYGIKWLHFFNAHNGYYGHELLLGEYHNGAKGEKIKEEYL